jgi:hypothetical protein
LRIAQAYASTFRCRLEVPAGRARKDLIVTMSGVISQYRQRYEWQAKGGLNRIDCRLSRHAWLLYPTKLIGTDYPYSPDGRTLQVDVLVFDKNNGSLKAYEVKRARQNSETENPAS